MRQSLAETLKKLILQSLNSSTRTRSRLSSKQAIDSVTAVTQSRIVQISADQAVYIFASNGLNEDGLSSSYEAFMVINVVVYSSRVIRCRSIKNYPIRM